MLFKNNIYLEKMQAKMKKSYLIAFRSIKDGGLI